MTVQTRLALALFLCAVSFVCGFGLRDIMADRDTAERDVGDLQSHVEAATEARVDDLGSQAAASDIEAERVTDEAESRIEYRYITQEVVRYVAANPSPAGCGLTADGLRIWRQASAGQHSKPVDPGRAAGPLP